mmetsp:Transcript_33881/g.107592  ORF Transcript_33881/g.107592 Transcript_33881/m.107592 type:complete len:243 (+) Transcript_33881:575-1303(+)
MPAVADIRQVVGYFVVVPCHFLQRPEAEICRPHLDPPRLQPYEDNQGADEARPKVRDRQVFIDIFRTVRYRLSRRLPRIESVCEHSLQAWHDLGRANAGEELQDAEVPSLRPVHPDWIRIVLSGFTFRVVRFLKDLLDRARLDPRHNLRRGFAPQPPELAGHVVCYGDVAAAVRRWVPDGPGRGEVGLGPDPRGQLGLEACREAGEDFWARGGGADEGRDRLALHGLRLRCLLPLLPVRELG